MIYQGSILFFPSHQLGEYTRWHTGHGKILLAHTIENTDKRKLLLSKGWFQWLKPYRKATKKPTQCYQKLWKFHWLQDNQTHYIANKILVGKKQKKTGPVEVLRKWIVDCRLETSENNYWNIVYQSHFLCIKVSKLTVFQFKLLLYIGD